MVSRIRSLGIRGIGGYEVSVEGGVSQGLPFVDVGGVPAAAAGGCGARVVDAIRDAVPQYLVDRES